MLAALGLAAVVPGVLAVLALHLISPTADISPYRRTISEYAYTSLGWVFNSAVLLISAGSLLILVGLVQGRHLRLWSIGTLTLLAWSVALVVLIIFPKHDWSVGPSTHGQIHRVASVIAFLSVPIAALSVGLRRRAGTAARWAAVFGGLSASIFGCIAWAVLTDSGGSGTPWWRLFPLGLMERGIAFFLILAVLCLGVLALHPRRAATSLPA